MRFIDEATISVSSGHGGPGSVSFRRETFVPRGGPDGGNGGDGGDVFFKANSQLGTLQDFRFRRSYRAGNGMHGSGGNKSGRNGQDIRIPVPVGTIIRESKTGQLLFDFTEDGQEWLACKGGRGGKGNTHFATATHQAPKFAQPGEEGQTLELKLELKLLADVGIIGFPNAGKSTLISRMSAARPKIADYPFTTLVPNLGVVSILDGSSFLVADIPGLVEGAHRGRGLGHKFLKHIERTRVFVHVLDGSHLLENLTSPQENAFETAIENLIKHYQIIRHEIGMFNSNLLIKPEILILNKIDLLESQSDFLFSAQKILQKRIQLIRGNPLQENEPYLISAVSGKGIENLLFQISERLSQAQADEGIRA